jgi:hypothetical protein
MPHIGGKSEKLLLEIETYFPKDFAANADIGAGRVRGTNPVSGIDQA